MATLILLRHGLTPMTGPVLAGRLPGVHLNDAGQQQAAEVAARLATLPLARIVSSPLERCKETAQAVAKLRPSASQSATPSGATMKVALDKRLLECDYGDWTGKQIKDLVKDPLWPVVQAHPSAATFPGGESMTAMQARAVAAVRAHDAELSDSDVWLACSHGDVIKAIIADALGMHLDLFQRIQVDPCSISVIRYTPLRPFVLRQNDTGGSVDVLKPQPHAAKGKKGKRPSSDAVVGGGAGTGR